MIASNRNLLTLLLALSVATLCGQTALGYVVLGTGTGALLDGDLTDPEDNGVDSPEPNGINWNWVSITANKEAFFDDNGIEPNRQGSFDIFDNKVGNGEQKYCCGGPVWNVTVEFAQPYVLTHFTVASSGDSPGRDPDVWQIKGSNNGTTWTNIYAYSNDGGNNSRNYAGNTQFTARNQVIRFDGGGVDFATPSAYKYFRINFDSSAGWVGTGGEAALGELELFGVVPEPATVSLLVLGGIVAIRRRRR